jgi:hypothetical protein
VALGQPQVAVGIVNVGFTVGRRDGMRAGVVGAAGVAVGECADGTGAAGGGAFAGEVAVAAVDKLGAELASRATIQRAMRFTLLAFVLLKSE